MGHMRGEHCKGPMSLATTRKKIWYTCMTEYYSTIKKNEIMPFAATWMDLETIILSEVSQKEIPYDITYMWNLKYDTNEFIYKTETDSQT